MSIGFPTNTVVLIIATMIGAGTAFWFSLSLGIRQLPLSQRVRRAWLWGAAILLFTWLIARLALSLLYPPGEAALTVPFLITFLSLGMLAGILPLLLSPTFRQIVRAIPQTWLVGVHAVRLAGFLS